MFGAMSISGMEPRGFYLNPLWTFLKVGLQDLLVLKKNKNNFDPAAVGQSLPHLSPISPN